MKTIQLALHNSDYAQSLRNLLLRDGAHRVFIVDQPDLWLDGVVVFDGKRIENFSMLDREPERFVVVTPKNSDRLERIWDTGVRHVVFEGDSPTTAHLAIIGAEMRLPNFGSSGVRAAVSMPSQIGPHAGLRPYEWGI
jgi:hypothetical protein